MTDDHRRPVRRRPAFHALRVAPVERLCDDAAAVTFDVPAELRRRRSPSRAGQSLTLRRDVDGGDERRSYSICAPAGRRAADRRARGPRRAVLLAGWCTRCGPATRSRCSRRPARSPPTRRAGRRGHVLLAAGSGITPMLSIAASRAGRDPDAARSRCSTATARTDSVMFAEELADLKNRYRPALQLRARALPRAPRRRAVLRPARRRPAARAAAGAGAVGDVDHFWLCGPFGMIVDAREVLAELGVPAERVHFELFYVDEPPPEPHRHATRVAGRRQRGDRRPRRPQRPRSPCRAGRAGPRRRPAGRAPTCRSPARAGSAAPAGPR